MKLKISNGQFYRIGIGSYNMLPTKGGVYTKDLIVKDIEKCNNYNLTPDMHDIDLCLNIKLDDDKISFCLPPKKYEQ